MPSPAKLLASASGITPDPYFRNVTLLLHGDGSNGAQNNTFLDSSSNNFTVTRNGNTTQGSFSPYGTRWSNYFDGSGDFLSAPSNAAFDLGGGDFTIECWFNANSFAAAFGLVSRYSVAPAGWFLRVINATTIRFYRADVASDITVSTMAVGAWYHVAAVRSGTTVTIYLNGSSVGAITGVSNFTDAAGTTVQIGRTNTITDDFPGYISDVRVVKGTAVYTANFTPPTAPLTAITNTSLLTCQSNRFRDASTNNFAITRNGDVRVTPFSPYAPTAPYSAAANGGSMYFDGTGDWLTGSSSMIPAANTSSFTIEGWIYPTTFANRIDVIGDMSPSIASDVKVIAAEVNTSGRVVLYWYDGAIRRCTGSTSMALNQWNYFAIVVNSNAIAIYVNSTTADTLSGTTTLTDRTQTHNFALGSYYGEPAFRGHLSNIRVSTVARTISAVPTAPLSSDANTRLLLNGTNAAIFDSAADNNLETVGNAQISTSVKKFGTGSMYFDGTGDWLQVNNDGAFYAFGTGDFTWEFWYHPLSFTNTAILLDFRTSGSEANGVLFTRPSTGSVWFNAAANTRITGTINLSLNTWAHIALTRAGGSTRLFINGVQSGSTYSDTNNYTGSPVRPLVGGDGFGGDASISANGYIDDLRITKGVARYTANFTPPAAPFPDQ